MPSSSSNRQSTPKSGGVYVISSPSGKQYIGSAINFARRWRVHKFRLRRGTHCNRKLQNAWNKHGELTFAPVLVCRPEDLLVYEQLLIDNFDPALNVLRIAGRSTGYRHSEETLVKLAQQRTGKRYGPRSAEHKLNASLSQKGREFTEEHKQKLRAARKRQVRPPMSEETKAKIAKKLRASKHYEEQRFKHVILRMKVEP